jgi:hypothetical protein
MKRAAVIAAGRAAIRRAAGRGIALLALALVPGAALACSPGEFTPSPVPVPGANCALRIDLSPYDSVQLGDAIRTPGGLILQPVGEGNGCYSRTNLLVHDCAAGQVMVIGTEHFDLMRAMEQGPEGRQTGLERIRDAALAAGGPRDLAGFAALSQSEGYGTPVMMRPDQSLRFGNRTLPVACACREARRSG